MYGGDRFECPFNGTVHSVSLSKILVSVRITVSVDSKTIRIRGNSLTVILESNITGNIIPATLRDVNGLVFLFKPHAA